jgi:epsilon-lactone hydrolase
MASPQSVRLRATLVNDRETLHIPLDKQRREWEAAAAKTVLPTTTRIETFEAEGIPCEWVCCSPRDHAQALFFLHGGGFNAGSPRTHRELAARLSLVTDLPILLADYRLAPEHPFPAALEDAVTVYRWLLRMGTRPKQIVLGGDSAGGGLAVSTLLALRDGGDPLPAAAILLSPWADLSLTGESLATRAFVDPTGSLEGLSAAAKLYLGQHDPYDPLISPVYADLTGLPPLFIQVGDLDVLLSDALRLVTQARSADVDVRVEVWLEMWHVWQAWAGELPEGQAALDQLGEYVRQKLGQQP